MELTWEFLKQAFGKVIDQVVLAVLGAILAGTLVIYRKYKQNAVARGVALSVGLSAIISAALLWLAVRMMPPVPDANAIKLATVEIIADHNHCHRHLNWSGEAVECIYYWDNRPQGMQEDSKIVGSAISRNTGGSGWTGFSYILGEVTVSHAQLFVYKTEIAGLPIPSNPDNSSSTVGLFARSVGAPDAKLQILIFYH